MKRPAGQVDASQGQRQYSTAPIEVGGVVYRRPGDLLPMSIRLVYDRQYGETWFATGEDDDKAHEQAWAAARTALVAREASKVTGKARSPRADLGALEAAR